MEPEAPAHSSNWKLSLAFGALMIFLALITATGAVSLANSAHTITNPSGATGLAFSGWFFVLSIFFGGIGMVFIFFAGSDRASEMTRRRLEPLSVNGAS